MIRGPDILQPTGAHVAPTQEIELRLAGLMRKSQKGDPVAYEELLRELVVLMRKFVHAAIHTTRFGDDGSSEDLAQEILLALHLKRHTYDPTQKFLPWIYAIARHKIVDRLRLKGSQRRLVEALTITATIEQQSSACGTENPDTEMAISAALSTLPANQKAVIELTKLEGLSVAEAAARTGLSESNIKVLTHRALKALKRHFVGESEDSNENR